MKAQGHYLRISLPINLLIAITRDEGPHSFFLDTAPDEKRGAVAKRRVETAIKKAA
jgi:hypothetical protein